MRHLPLVIPISLLAVISLIYALGPIMASHDLRRLAQHKKPIFARYSGGFLDGGSRLYEGPGYYLRAKHSFIPESDPIRYDIGVDLSFMIPFYRRFDYETTVESDD